MAVSKVLELLFPTTATLATREGGKVLADGVHFHVVTLTIGGERATVVGAVDGESHFGLKLIAKGLHLEHQSWLLHRDQSHRHS
jgi:hypothetical protein